jgi:O-antigen ligase
MTLTSEANPNKVESRTHVYSTSWEHLPDVFWTGIGVGNYWNKWGFEVGLANGSVGSLNVSGTHNCFIQATIYWGILGLVALLGIYWQAYRCLPKVIGKNEVSLALLGLSVSLFLFSMVMHELYAKEFSLGLGLLAGSKYWIWSRPRGQRRSALPKPL